MNNYFKHTSINGMEIILIKKEGYVKSYAGIGVKFGASNLTYEENGKIFKLKPGIAHFLEHKLFAQKEGFDAFSKFTKMNASSNAYTTNDKTVYYFQTNDELKNPLSLLLNMYYNPYFTDSNVESEKDIIDSELKMNMDDVGYLYSNKILDEVYPDDDYSKLILGTEEDIKSITKEDLYQAYNAFYTPKNTVLCVVSDIEPNELFTFIDNELKKYQYSDSNAIKLSSITSLKPKSNISYFVNEKITQTEISIVLRLDDVTNKDPISCELLLGVFEALLNVNDKLYQKLDDENLLSNDIDFNVNTSTDTSYIMLSFTTDNPLKVDEIVRKSIKNLKFEDLKKDLLEIYLKRLKAKYILEEDSIEPLGDKALGLSLEDIDYIKMNDELINLKVSDINRYIESIKNAKISSIISKKN